jgi:putative redox protein
VSDVQVEARWEEEGLRFEAMGRSGVPVLVDGDGAAGPSPVETLLVGLAACMGADVVEILAKMRVPLAGLTVRAEGDRRPEAPRRYTAIRLTYRASGVPEDDEAKLQRAVDLSRDAYCSVLHSLRPDIDLSIRIEAG